MIELNLARIESIFSNVDDRVERGTNHLDFHKIESIFSAVDDRVDRGTNQLDFHKIESIFSTVDDRVDRGSIFKKSSRCTCTPPRMIESNVVQIESIC